TGEAVTTLVADATRLVLRLERRAQAGLQIAVRAVGARQVRDTRQADRGRLHARRRVADANPARARQPGVAAHASLRDALLIDVALAAAFDGALEEPTAC